MPLSSLNLNMFYHLSIQFTVTSTFLDQRSVKKNCSSEMLSEHKPLQILHSGILKILSFVFKLQSHIHVYGFLLGLSIILTRLSQILTASEEFYGSRGSKAAECSSLTDHIQTSALPRILSVASAPDCHSHPLTFHLYLSPNVLAPRIQYAVLHPSFLRRFHLPSLYISLTLFPTVFALSFSTPPLLSLSL